MKLLELKNVSYRYKDAAKDEYVLKNINYIFEPGKMYVIKGRSGSGKTTFLSLISGLETNYEGNILYKGKELKKINLDKYRNTDIGIVFQSYNLLPSFTTLENIVLSMDINGTINDKKKNALNLMKTVGLNENYKNRRILKLSGGEQQRVSIARSISYNPNIIIADEPTGNLDEKTENEIMEIFKKQAIAGKCVIIVTHSENVSKYADYIYELKKEMN